MGVKILCGTLSLYVSGAILVFQNNETAAMLVSQTNPLGVELLVCKRFLLCSKILKGEKCWPREWERAIAFQTDWCEQFEIPIVFSSSS